MICVRSVPGTITLDLYPVALQTASPRTTKVRFASLRLFHISCITRSVAHQHMLYLILDPNLNLTNDFLPVYKYMEQKMLSCHAAHEFSRCYIRGESKESIAHR